MKNYITLLTLILFLGGCTLSMEEWELEEEEKGFEEPNTVDTDFGTVTYQYNEGTIYVSDKVQEYLVNVENDSILYFLPNMPERSRPAVGNMLASGCTHKLPMGLNHRVIAVEDVAGLLKVTCTKISYEEVYKELSYCVDADVATMDLSGLTDEQLESLGYQRIDSVIVDWAIYDSVKGINTEKLQLRRRMERLTRVDDENNYTEDSLFKNVVHDWYLDTRDIQKIKAGIGQSRLMWDKVCEAIKAQVERQQAKHDYLKDLYVGLRWREIIYSQVHTEKNLKKYYEKHYTDTWAEEEISAEVGIEVTKKPKEKLTQDKIGKTTMDWTEGTTKWASVETAVGTYWMKTEMVPKTANSPWSTPPVRHILPGPVPLTFIAGINVTPQISFGGSFCVSGTYVSDKIRAGYEVKHGSRRKIQEVVEKGHFRFNNAALNGHFKIGASVRAWIGLELACALSATVGANLTCFFEGEGELSNGNIDEKTGERSWEPQGGVRFYLDFFGDVQTHIAPLGMHMWDKKLWEFATVHILDFNTRLEPKYKDVISYCNPAEYDKFRAHAQFSLGSSALFDGFVKTSEYKPAMQMFIGPVKDNNFTYMIPDADYGGAEIGNTYEFTYLDAMPGDVSELHFRPCLLSMGNHLPGFPDIIYGDINDAAFAEIGRPDIYTLESKQAMGQPLYDFNEDPKKYLDYEYGKMDDNMSIDYSKVNLREYEFYTTVRVSNGSRIGKWGIHVRIYSPTGKKLISKKIPINKAKSGYYTILFSFITNWEKPDGVDQRMYYYVQPYWEELGDVAKYEADDDYSLSKYYLEYEVPYDPDFKRKHSSELETFIKKDVQ